jgi:hypothetical protein
MRSRTAASSVMAAQPRSGLFWGVGVLARLRSGQPPTLVVDGPLGQHPPEHLGEPEVDAGEQPEREGGQHDEVAVAEDRLAAEDGQDLGDDPEGRDGHDVDLGWPKNQNMCCHSTGSPPSKGWKNAVPKFRSRYSRAGAAVIEGKANRISSCRVMIPQVNKGGRNMVMPGMRMVTIVVSRLTAPSTLAMPVGEPLVVRLRNKGRTARPSPSRGVDGDHPAAGAGDQLAVRVPLPRRRRDARRHQLRPGGAGAAGPTLAPGRIRLAGSAGSRGSCRTGARRAVPG